MLIKIPFPVDVSGRSKHEGIIYANPEDISAVNRSFERVHIMMKNGKAFASIAPKSRLAVHNGELVQPADAAAGAVELDHMPDAEKLDEWLEDTVKLINESTSRFPKFDA